LDSAIWTAIITGCFSFLTFILTRIFTKSDKREADKKEDEEEVENLESKIEKRFKETDERSDRTDERIAKIEKSIAELLECQKQQSDVLQTIGNASRDTLRNSIIVMYNKYMSDDYGYFPIYERESLDHAVKSYYALGGNSVVPSLVEKLLSLPTEKEDVDKE